MLSLLSFRDGSPILEHQALLYIESNPALIKVSHSKSKAKCLQGKACVPIVKPKEVL